MSNALHHRVRIDSGEEPPEAVHQVVDRHGREQVILEQRDRATGNVQGSSAALPMARRQARFRRRIAPDAFQPPSGGSSWRNREAAMGSAFKSITRGKFFKGKYVRRTLGGLGGAMIAAVAWKLGEDIYEAMKRRFREAQAEPEAEPEP
jgi:hypothetical protein